MTPTSLFERGWYAPRRSSNLSDGAVAAVASWLYKPVAILRGVITARPLPRNRTRPGTRVRTANDGGSGADGRCRFCRAHSTQRVCAACASAGFTEMRCGCVERPDGTRYSCDALIEKWIDTPFAGASGMTDHRHSIPREIRAIVPSGASVIPDYR